MSRRVAAGLLTAVLLGLLAGATQAKSFAGAVPDIPTAASAPSAAASPFGPIAHAAFTMPYLGGPVLHSSYTHAIFWQPAGSMLTFDPGYIALVEQFLTGVAADSRSTESIYGISGQYADAHGAAAYDSVYAGAVVDTDTLPANQCHEPSTGPGWSVCLTDAQLSDEIRRVISVDHLPAHGNNIFVLLTPNGFGSCEDETSQACALGGASGGYCGYHSSTGNGILYAVVPYNAVSGHCQSGNPRPNSSTADPALSTVAHEQIETITDPLGDAYIDSSGEEIADRCMTAYGPSRGGTGAGRWNETIDHGHYWLQDVFARIGHRCEPRPSPDRVRIAVANIGRTLVAQARATMPGGKITAYRWWFGDGRSASGRSVRHTYARAGTYKLVLRATDSAGNWSFTRGTVRVRA